ncbi:protein-methionine-sulfoxide reductase catalytic subunit MsrP [Massilia sp. TS11]|uniref:protein-methionine-sulfoxide reductase catalytic subunit MsrP n=1 Tax=Massilia sp. TS11 TaxID=2908003 RepID=UPI001EDBB944|nr:protein-methionine-sulfoxide reductase catalytic subunit MsrP [Massilia sp. TS11]MCG2584902.1 protein-methionine-sulfoxide reductase catalytic subunit MsrP [Massilia sp. TS11]
MRIHRRPNGIDLPFSSEITPQAVFEQRRRFIKTLGLGAIAGTSLWEMSQRAAHAQSGARLAAKLNPGYAVLDKQTSFKDATSYNNFYEFGTDKSDPAENAHTLKTRPWTVAIEGEVKKPQVLDLDALLKLAPLEERVYRLRCVEGWSMVIPWIGYSLSELIKKVEPNGNAKFVEFHSLADPKQMPGVRSAVLDWPYVEGLRLDEAMHPLALLTLGMYGQVLPNQNGAPVRLTVPWKYGFKSAKSIVKIRFTRDMPRTSWWLANPREYGFYSNVNPEVDHPRWSQASERRVGEDGFFAKKRKTLMFNGYAEVASLYSGMDLRKYY